MNTTTRYILLAIVVVVIGGSIVYLQSLSARHGTSTAVAGSDIAVPTDGTIATTTDSNGHVSTTTAKVASTHSAAYAIHKLTYPPAKELVSPDGYINTGGTPITIGSLIGKKVILVDFWTYSCINCQRTIPYLEGWYTKYKDDGLVIIGVHTPEFAFEKQIANVKAAVQKFGITYPVALDSNYNTWDAYGNNYWPEEYLIDIDGLVREHNIGEGNYAETEKNIQQLLKERAQTLGLTLSVPSSTLSVNDAVTTNSPETYFNWSRNQYLGNGKQQVAGSQTFTLPTTPPPANTYYLSGTWNITNEYAENTTDSAEITYTYDAKNVYFVAGAPNGASITVLRDGKPLAAEKGSDVDANGQVQINSPRLYKLISESSASTHTITIIVHGTGLQAFTFTFG